MAGHRSRHLLLRKLAAVRWSCDAEQVASDRRTCDVGTSARHSVVLVSAQVLNNETQSDTKPGLSRFSRKMVASTEAAKTDTEALRPDGRTRN